MWNWLCLIDSIKVCPDCPILIIERPCKDLKTHKENLFLSLSIWKALYFRHSSWVHLKSFSDLLLFFQDLLQMPLPPSSPTKVQLLFLLFLIPITRGAFTISVQAHLWNCVLLPGSCLACQVQSCSMLSIFLNFLRFITWSTLQISCFYTLAQWPLLELLTFRFDVCLGLQTQDCDYPAPWYPNSERDRLHFPSIPLLSLLLSLWNVHSTVWINIMQMLELGLTVHELLISAVYCLICNSFLDCVLVPWFLFPIHHFDKRILK